MRSFVSRALPSGLAALLAACSGGSRDVVLETYSVFDTRDTAVRVDDTYEGDIALLVPNGEGYDVHADAEITVGSVRFRGVPEGTYFIEYRRPEQTPLFVEHDESHIQNTSHHVGRQSTPAAEGTQIRVSGSFVEPWTSSNMLEVFSERAYMDRRVRANAASQPNAPTAAATSVTDWTIVLDDMSDPYGMPTPLVDASQGDDLSVFVSRTRVPNDELPDEHPWASFSYRTITEAADATGTTFVDGDVAGIDASFAPVPPQEVTLDLRATAIREALTEGIEGIDYAVGVWVEAHAEPIFEDRLLVGHGGRLFATTSPAWTLDDAHPSDRMQTFDYGDPFGEGRLAMGGVYINAYFVVMDPVSNEPEEIVTGYVIYKRLDDLASAPVEPTMSLPRNITVGGLAVPLRVEGVIPGVGLTPLITWEAPSSGNAMEYEITLIDTENELDGEDIVETSHQVLRAITRQPSFRVPAGMLESGHDYAVLVTAREEDGSLLTVSAQAASGFFTP